jgi:hypothetical protein
MSKVYNNAITTTAGFQYNSDSPLDDRLVVETFEDLSTITKYEGMIVYVVNDKKSYELINAEWEPIVTEKYVDNKIATASQIQIITWEADD